ncbi:MAG: hypothetical protein H0W34_08885 [Pyrinomonadaceae bacterium]|nr:hypothetical protein [Pyrinomonadaceae bacterium]
MALSVQWAANLGWVASSRAHTFFMPWGKIIPPFGDAVRPFVFNADETLMFANVNNFFGVEVANMTTGKVIHRVPVTRFNYTPKTL